MREITVEIPKNAELTVKDNIIKVIFRSEFNNKLYVKLKVNGKQTDSKEIIASKKNKIHLQI